MALAGVSSTGKALNKILLTFLSFILTFIPTWLSSKELVHRIWCHRFDTWENLFFFSSLPFLSFSFRFFFCYCSFVFFFFFFINCIFYVIGFSLLLNLPVSPKRKCWARFCDLRIYNEIAIGILHLYYRWYYLDQLFFLRALENGL